MCSTTCPVLHVQYEYSHPVRLVELLREVAVDTYEVFDLLPKPHRTMVDIMADDTVTVGVAVRGERHGLDIVEEEVAVPPGGTEGGVGHKP